MAIHSDARPRPMRQMGSGRLMRDLPLAARLLIIVLAAVAGFMLASWFAYLQIPPPAAGVPGAAAVLNQGAYCGNGYCESGESCSKCPTDCGKCSTCGDGVCDSSETCATCTTDCCPGTNQCDNVTCNNNGVCDAPCEDVYNCGDCPSFCGDNICAAHEVDSCCGAGNDCTVAITCGDGICSACENSSLCPADCTGQPTEEPTTAVPTTVVPTTAAPVTKAATTAGSTATSVPNTATATVTLTATATATGSATPTITPTPEPEQECGLVAYESRPAGWQAAYGTSTNPGDYIPVQAEDLEVWVCPVPPEGERLCIPIYSNLLEPVDSDLARISLVDCSDVGVCRTFDQIGQLDGDQLCFTINAATNPTCAVGCALSPDAGGFALPFPWWYLLLAAGLLLLLLLILLLIRRRRDDDDSDDGMEGMVTSQRPPTSPGSGPAPPPYDPSETMLETPSDDPGTMRVPPVPPPTDQH